MFKARQVAPKDANVLENFSAGMFNPLNIAKNHANSKSCNISLFWIFVLLSHSFLFF